MGERLWVLCLNDYPVGVFQTKAKADRAQAEHNDPNNGRYFHVHEVPFTRGLR